MLFRPKAPLCLGAPSSLLGTLPALRRHLLAQLANLCRSHFELILLWPECEQGRPAWEVSVSTRKYLHVGGQSWRQCERLMSWQSRLFVVSRFRYEKGQCVCGDRGQSVVVRGRFDYDQLCTYGFTQNCRVPFLFYLGENPDMYFH